MANNNQVYSTPSYVREVSETQRFASQREVTVSRSSQKEVYLDYHKSLNELALSFCNNQNIITCDDHKIFNNMQICWNQMECAPMIPQIVAQDINDLQDVIEINILVDKFNTSYNVYLRYYYLLLSTVSPSRNDISIMEYQINQMIVITTALIRLNERYFNRINGGVRAILNILASNRHQIQNKINQKFKGICLGYSMYSEKSKTTKLTN